MRDNSVTIAKGIAIMLMVLGHAECPSYLNTYLGMLRMPLFFFMSGYCFKEKYLDDARSYLKKRVTGIYWPYLKWSLFFLLIHNICFYTNIYSDEYGFLGKTSVLYSSPDFLSHAISIVTKMSGHEQLVGGFWFLKSLFIGSIIFFICRKLLRQTPIVGAMLLLMAAVLLSYLNKKMPYFGIGSRECLAATLLFVGHLYKQHQLNWHRNIWFVLTSIVMVGVGTVFWPASMLSYTYWKVIPYTITSVMGTLAIFGLSYHLSLRSENSIVRFLVYVGGYTFNVLTWHFLSMKTVSLFIVYVYGLPVKQLSEFPAIGEYASQGWWIAYFVVGTGIPILGTYSYHRLKDSITRKNH